MNCGEETTNAGWNIGNIDVGFIAAGPDRGSSGLV